MKPNLREKAGAGIPCFGLSLTLPTTATVEMAACAGYDFVRIDCEHALFDHRILGEMLATARHLKLPCQVRMPSLDHVTALLGLEADGIMIPHVESAADARRAVELCKFAPLGKRGMDGGSRMIRYGGMSRAEHMAYSDENVHIIIQIESLAGMERIDEILSTPGIDFVATGRADLSQELGVPGEKNHPKVRKAESLIVRKALEHGKLVTLAETSATRIRRLMEQGVFCFVTGKDESLAFQAIQGKLGELRGSIT